MEELVECCETPVALAKSIRLTLAIIEEQLCQLLLDKSNRQYKQAWFYLAHHFNYTESGKAKKQTSEGVKIIVLPQKKPVGSPVPIEHKVVGSVLNRSTSSKNVTPNKNPQKKKVGQSPQSDKTQESTPKKTAKNNKKNTFLNTQKINLSRKRPDFNELKRFVTPKIEEATPEVEANQVVVETKETKRPYVRSKWNDSTIEITAYNKRGINKVLAERAEENRRKKAEAEMLSE